MSISFRNPVLVLAVGLPAIAVVASLLTLGIAIRTSDGQLPEQYHWEGFQLDRDFSRAARAAELNVHVTLAGLFARGACQLNLKMQGNAPQEIVVTLAHGTRAELDRRTTFRRVPSNTSDAAGEAVYASACSTLPEGHWRLELVDAVNGWAIRRSVYSGAAPIVLAAASGNEG